MAYYFRIETARNKFVGGGPFGTITKARKGLISTYVSKYRKKYPHAELQIWKDMEFIGNVDYSLDFKKWAWISEVSDVSYFINSDGTLNKKISNREWNVIMGFERR